MATTQQHHSQEKILEQILARLTQLEDKMAGGASAGERSVGGGDEEDTRRKIFGTLFSDPSLVVRFGKGLSANNRDEVNAVIKTANSGQDYRLSADQVDGLRDLWLGVPYGLVGPYDKEKEQIRLEGMWFWRELVSLLPNEVDGFHTAITNFRNAPDDPAKWNEVKRYFDMVGVGHHWTRDHALALGQISTADPKFKNLRWFGLPGDLW